MTRSSSLPSRQTHLSNMLQADLALSQPCSNPFSYYCFLSAMQPSHISSMISPVNAT